MRPSVPPWWAWCPAALSSTSGGVDIPPTHEDYIHRVGRTGRNQSGGDAFAFVSRQDAIQFTAWTGNGLSCPVRQFGGAQTFRVTVDQEELYGCAGHTRRPSGGSGC